MLLPTKRTINPTAAKRLKAIEEYSQLGAGFRIALRDLEIRGAGNILGFEQSGHIDAVGYELYCQLLDAAVKRRKKYGQALVLALSVTTDGHLYTQPSVHLELNIDCHIPRSYIASDRQRMDVYRRMTTCTVSADLDQLEKDLIDLFGTPPQPVQHLLQLAEIRVLAANWPIRSIIQEIPDLIFSVETISAVEPLFAHLNKQPHASDKRAAVPTRRDHTRISIPDERTIHLRLPNNYFDAPVTILAVLRKLLAIAH